MHSSASVGQCSRKCSKKTTSVSDGFSAPMTVALGQRRANLMIGAPSLPHVISVWYFNPDTDS